MAKTFTPTNGWTDFAVMTPSTPQFNKKGEPVKWRVQTNESGQWRCYCPSFIFSKMKPKTCKHIRLCQQTQAQEAVAITTPVAAAIPAVATKHPQWDSAYAICSAMLDQARLYANEKQRNEMITVLSQKLAAFVPTKVAPVVVTAPVAVGVRYITFDD